MELQARQIGFGCEPEVDERATALEVMGELYDLALTIGPAVAR
jgi:hypothetical protein